MSDELKELLSLVHQYQVSLIAAQGEVSFKDTRIAELETDYKTQRDAKEQLVERISELEDEAGRAATHAVVVDVDNMELQRRIRELERKLAASQGEVLFKDTRIRELETTVSACGKSLEARDRYISELTEQLADRVTNARY
jgi:chromosome segregation ATPase